MKKYNINQIKSGDFSEVTQGAKEALNNKSMRGFVQAIDFAAQNDEFMATFTKSFNKAWGPGSNVKFAALDESEVTKQFDILQTNVQSVIATSILPTVEQLIRSDELLNRITIEDIVPSANVQMYDFDQEQDAAILAEIASGTDVDDILRTGDLLLPNQKVQASMKMSEFAISTLNAAQFGTFIARLARRVRVRLVTAILQNGSAAPNGTARGSNIRGILNNYGVNGTGDTTNTIGAIAYATKAAADAAITAAGGVASTDAYDLCLKVKALLLPSNVTDILEEDYIYVMNRTTWGVVSTVLDTTGRAKARSNVDPATGRTTRTIDGAEVLLVPTVACPNNRVNLFPARFYKLVTAGGLMNLTDDGIVELRQGLYSFVSRMWVNGSMEYGQRFRPTTAVVIGTTVPDNADQNAFRVFNIT